MDWIINNDNNVINSRDDLRAHYSAIDSETYGTVGGPDKYSQCDGVFLMADLEHEISDGVQLSLSANHERIFADGLGRENADKVQDGYNTNIFGSYPRPNVELDPEQQYVKTYWTKSDLDTERYNTRSSLVFENDWFNATNRLILGWDFSYQKKEEYYYDQVPVGAVGANVNGNQLAPGAYVPIGRASGNTVNGQFRAYEYIDIANLSSDRSILRFNNIIESDVPDLPFENVSTGNFSHLEYPNAEWALARTTESEIMGNSLWCAGQSEWLDGRLHTLIGLRYDYIKIDSAFRKVLFYGYDLGNDDENNNQWYDRRWPRRLRNGEYDDDDEYEYEYEYDLVVVLRRRGFSLVVHPRATPRDARSIVRSIDASKRLAGQATNFRSVDELRGDVLGDGGDGDDEITRSVPRDASRVVATRSPP